MVIVGLALRFIENLVERLSEGVSVERCITRGGPITGVNELGNVVAWRKANTNGVFRATARVIVLDLFS